MKKEESIRPQNGETTMVTAFTTTQYSSDKTSTKKFEKYISSLLNRIFNADFQL